MCCVHSFSISLSEGSIGDLDAGEDNPPDDVSLSGEEAGASDQDDSAECDESSPSFAPLYNEGKKDQYQNKRFCLHHLNYSKMILFALKSQPSMSTWSELWSDEKKKVTDGN